MFEFENLEENRKQGLVFHSPSSERGGKDNYFGVKKESKKRELRRLVMSSDKKLVFHRRTKN